MEKQLIPCRKWKSAMSALVDGTLSAKEADRARNHAAQCPACARLLAEFEAGRAALRAMDKPQLSAEFDQRLAMRLAELSQGDRRKYRWSEAASAFWSTLAMQRQFVALGTAAVAIVMLCAVPTPRPADTRQTDDSALVTQCLAQHRSYASTQPLSDWSAQNLVTSTDSSAIPADFTASDSETD